MRALVEMEVTWDLTEPDLIIRLGNWRMHMLSDLVDCFKAVLVLAAVRESHGNLSQAARVLGITRQGLYKLIERQSLTRDDLIGRQAGIEMRELDIDLTVEGPGGDEG